MKHILKKNKRNLPDQKILVSQQMTKTCTMCLKEKPRDEFYDNITCADGYSPKCKKCCRKMNKYYYQMRKAKPKQKLLPFVYHPRCPEQQTPGSDLKVEKGPIRITFD